MSDQLAALSQWIDDAQGDRDPEAILWGRVSKITEEAGEAIAALIGLTGQNPRKGVTHTMGDLQDELDRIRACIQATGLDPEAYADDVPALAVALLAILDLHAPIDDEPNAWCRQGCSFHPCRTVRAISEAFNS